MFVRSPEGRTRKRPGLSPSLVGPGVKPASLPVLFSSFFIPTPRNGYHFWPCWEWARSCAVCISFTRSQQSCVQLANEDTELTLGQCPQVRAASRAPELCSGTRDPRRWGLMSRCLSTDHSQPALPLFHLPLPLSLLWATLCHPSRGLLVVSLTQNFPSSSHLEASAKFTSCTTTSSASLPWWHSARPPCFQPQSLSCLRPVLTLLPDGSPGQFLWIFHHSQIMRFFFLI